MQKLLMSSPIRLGVIDLNAAEPARRKADSKLRMTCVIMGNLEAEPSFLRQI